MVTTAKESSLQGKILKDLRSFGKHIVAFKLMRASDNGLPDIVFTTKCTGTVFIEVKRRGEKPRQLQEFMIDKLNNCGSKAFSCDSWERWIEIKNELGLFLVNIVSAL